MEINVKLTLDEKTEKVVEDLASAINNLAASNKTCNCSSSPEFLKPVGVDTLYSHNESTTDKDINTIVTTPTTEGVESEKPKTKINYETLRLQSKEKTVELVKKGKGKKIKALLDEYKKSAVSELEDDQLASFMEKLEEV